jgi:hypothetical protein
VDDAVIFLKPDPVDIHLTLDMLDLFGKVSNLHTNFQKSSVLPIRCDEHSLTVAKEILPCEFTDFPCKYLRLPLSLKMLTKPQVQIIVDRMTYLLPGWKSELMNQARPAIHVQFMMTT